MARAEAEQIAEADQQYVVPTNGEPLRGLIQDHVVTGALLTKRDTFLTREEFQQLVFSSCANTIGRDVLRTLKPAIVKPAPLWTGKQVVCTHLWFCYL